MDLKKPEESSFNDVYKRNKKLLKFFFLFIGVVSFFICGWLASEFLKKKGYNGLFDFTVTAISNYKNSLKADPEKISIEITDKDFKKLEKNRVQALERGIIINDLDGDYVPAVINYKGKKIKVKLRLKGHMTDHLQDNKWSFRIKIKEKNETFMGMKRFSIQHPGTRGYIYEWIYHELMKQEDIIALRYKFINVSVNGRDWGIYCVEENFENELLKNNNRVEGPILRLNPDMYWVNRYNTYVKSNSADEFASYYSANPEAYREDKVLTDSIQKRYYMKAIALIEGLRSKKISVNQAFDIPRLARFHAIIDLVGGVHSIDWSDIKYYYNPVIGKLEPIAYESFTVLYSRDLSSQYRYTEIDSAVNYKDWHSMIFSNKLFFKEYIKNLERMTKPKYLDAFFDASNKELNSNLAIIYKEFPYKKFDKADYYKRQKMILKILDPPKSLHAFLSHAEKNAIVVQIGAIDALPVQVHSIVVNKQEIEPLSEIILPCKQAGEYVTFKEYRFESGKELVVEKQDLDSVNIKYSILGSSEIKECKIFPYPHTESEFITDDLKNRKGNPDSFSFLVIDEVNKIIKVEPGIHVIEKDLIIPPGYAFVVKAGVSLDFKNKAKIISYSPLFFNGNEDERIWIESSDSTGQGIISIQTELKSKLNYVTFKNLPEISDKQWNRMGCLTFYESPVEFYNCAFYNCKAKIAVNLIRSDFSFKGCFFQNMKSDVINCSFSDGKVINCAIEDCREDALDITMGKVDVKSVYINNAGNKAINLKSGAQLKGNDVQIKKSDIAISAEDLSVTDLKQVKISDSKIGIAAYKNKAAGGQPTVYVSNLTIANVGRNFLRESKSVIIVNGVSVKDVVSDAETIIKSENKKK
ncbi:MAG: hypothetical protein K0S44_3238 [Bacteroidetes bacterium]|jgi:hypothetical protein|nr:hypothetical protein [Bacteroidota bacterium]